MAAPISPSGEPLGRVGLSSIGDLVVLEQGVLAGGARRVLTTVDEAAGSIRATRRSATR